ncbi:MAG: adenosylcobinamide-phosphate synthase CbiB [Pseudomonadota bacterium]
MDPPRGRPVTLAFVMLLDAVFGEPKWLWDRVPHPAVLMGRAVKWMDDRFNRGRHRKAAGVVSLVALCGVSLAVGWFLTAVPGGDVIEVLAAAILLAHKSLVEHVKAVADGLRSSLDQGKHAVAMIVGRDTRDMDEPAVARAAIESAAENFSDGVVAPLFWLLVAGLPGMLLYKMVNTADSMIGYVTPRHRDFGWAAAKLDDLLNLIPARVTAVLIALVYRKMSQWSAITTDARRHRSPNAGWPEAAMARALNIALAGPRSYEGKLQSFPFVHPDGRQTANSRDIDASIRVLWSVWAVLFVCALALGAIR